MGDFLFSTCYLRIFWTALSKSLIPNIESGGGRRIDREGIMGREQIVDCGAIWGAWRYGWWSFGAARNLF